MIRKLYKYLSSLRFTILLICLLGFIFALGLWVPQQSLLKSIYVQWQKKSPDLVAFLDFLGLTTIYTSPITMTLWLLFFVNLTLVLWQRYPIIKNKISISGIRITDPEATPGFPFKASYALPEGMDAASVISALRKRRYLVLEGTSGFYAIKNRLAPIAFMLFHVSFFLVLLGGIITVYTQFDAFVDLAEGESFKGELNRYNISPEPSMPKVGSPPEVFITVKSIIPHVTHNTPTGIDIELIDEKGKRQVVGVNTPYTTNHTSFVYKHLGMAPLFVLKNAATGKEIQGAYFKLDVLMMRKDVFALGDFTFKATFYPDYVLHEGKRATRSMEFNNPLFFIVVEKGGEKVAEGLIPKNGVLEFSGYRLELREQPFWVRFYVTKMRGLSFLYAGFILATIGVIWRLLFFRREIMAAVREQDGVHTLLVAGRSEYYKSLAEDEFSKMFSEITAG